MIHPPDLPDHYADDDDPVPTGAGALVLVAGVLALRGWLG